MSDLCKQQQCHSGGQGRQKILEPFLDLCVSSLREGHANLLCIVPILTDVTEVTQCKPNFYVYIHGFFPTLASMGYKLLICSAISITVHRHSACHRIIASQTLCISISTCAMPPAIAPARCIHPHVKTSVLLGKSTGILSDGRCLDVSL